MSSNVLRQARESLKVIERAYSQEPGKSLRFLKKNTYANLYLYLTGRALRGVPNRRNGLYAARFLWQAFVNDPRILEQVSYVLTLIFKMLTAIILPPQKALTFRVMIKSFGRRNHQNI